MIFDLHMAIQTLKGKYTMQTNTSIAATVSLLLAVYAAGCGQPQAGAENVELISSLRTAISAQNLEWLEANLKIIDERHTAGQLSDAAYKTFQAIITKAEAGKWNEAEQDAIAFQKAQQPTREQIERATRHAS